MTIFARLHKASSATARTRSSLAVLIAASLALLAALALAAAPAGAVVTTVGGTTVGLQPNNEEFFLDATLKVNLTNEAEPEPQPETFANATGNPVVHGSNIYAVYWDPTNHYHGDWQELINGFLHGVAHDSNEFSNVFAVSAQYTDRTNVPAYNRESFRGAYTDTTAYPTTGNCTDPNPLTANPAHQIKAITCLTDAQVQAELQSFIAQHSLPRGMNSIFYLLTPPGVAVCLDAGGATGHCSDFEKSEESYEHGFCSYHSAINPGGLPTGDTNSLLYGVIPWTAGGIGDGQLALQDQTKPFWCQEGWFNPASTPIEHAPKSINEVVLQEPNQVKCPSADGFCDRGLADLIINQIAVEQQNIVTNPLLNSWHDSAGKEATDECRNFFAPTTNGSYPAIPGGSGAGTLTNQVIGAKEYFINTAFDLAALKLSYPGIPCLPGLRLEPKFTAPLRVNAGDVVGFDGMESNFTLNAAEHFPPSGPPTTTYATYTWNFGDGTLPLSGYAPGAPACTTPWLSPCAASVFHSYTYGGEYNVTLTVTDTAGDSATTTQNVTVVGPPPPSPPPVESAPGTGSTSKAGTAGGPGAETSSSVPAPLATAAIVSHSLKTAARRGLAVRYSVNEQVAGRFEVLLPLSVAKHLGISGVPAAGMPAGSAPQVIVAKSILITTKAGRATVSIPFSKRTSGHLGRTRKLTLTLRLIVRNAASHPPASTTVVLSLIHI